MVSMFLKIDLCIQLYASLSDVKTCDERNIETSKSFKTERWQMFWPVAQPKEDKDLP